MLSPENELDLQLEEKLSAFRAVPARKPRSAERGRATFLKQADEIIQAVSVQPKPRHKGWIDPITQLFKRKERSPMFSPLVSVLLVVTLLAGGSGATVYAAQGSLPGQPLYEVKMLAEDARLGLANNSQAGIDLNLAFVNRRIDEIQNILENGGLPPAPVLARLQTQLDRALELSAGLEEDRLAPALERIRQNLQIQDQRIQQMQLSAQFNPQCAADLARVRELIRERLSWVEGGIKDPQAFQSQIRTRLRLNNPQPVLPVPTQPQSGTMAGPHPSQTAGAANGPGPYVTGTPAPGSSYGPGPGANQPAGGNPGPVSTQTPAQNGGNGPGPGPQPDSTCTPQAGPGSNPEPGQGGNGGSGQNGGAPQQQPGGGNGTGGGGQGGKP